MLVGFLLAATISTANAGKTYTPAQLRQMVQSQNFPDQGDVQTTVAKRSYAACVIALEGIISAIQPNYPTATIVNTSLIRTEKAWTNDAAVTVTCSAPDEKLIITTAPYR